MKSSLSMTQSKFFQLCLFFPFAAWLIGLVVFAILNNFSYSIILNHVFDATRVFVPYLVFAAGVWKLVNNRTYGQLLFIAFVAPVLWGLFFLLCFVLSSFITKPDVDRTALWMMAFWATVVAYLAEIIPYTVLMTFKNDFKPAAQQKEVSELQKDIRQLPA